MGGRGDSGAINVEGEGLSEAGEGVWAKLAALGFEVAELIGVPGGGVSEGDGFGLCGGNNFQTGGKCSIVVVDQVSGGGIWSEGRVRDGVSQDGGEEGGVYGLEITESDGAFMFDKRGGDVYVQSNGRRW